MSGRDRLADFQAQGGNQGYGQQQGQPNQYGQQYQPQNQFQHSQNQYAQQQQFAQQQQSQYQQQQYPPPTRIEMGAISPNDMGAFFREATSIHEDITRLERNIAQIEGLHDASINNVATDDQSARIKRQLEEITSDTTQLSNRIKRRIKDIEVANLRLGNAPDDQIRRTQAATLKEKFLNTLRQYQTSESEARRKYQARMERQYKIVKPEATQAEIAQALESDNQQVFAQSVLQSTRYGDANSALREVQTRHDDIKKIEKTILDLQQLFIDMETLVTDQGVVLDAIHDSVAQTDAQLDSGNQQVDNAISNAKGARRKKWICLIISIIILVVIVIVVLKATNVI